MYITVMIYFATSLDKREQREAAWARGEGGVRVRTEKRGSGETEEEEEEGGGIGRGSVYVSAFS